MSSEKHGIEIPGTPVAQPRHRVSARGGFARTYLPKQHPVHEYKRRIAEYTEDWPVFAGPLNVYIELAFPMPASWSYKKQAAMREAWHTQKPDIDNVVKAILDALKDRWKDDTQVVRLTVDKRWTDCEQGWTWLEILELTRASATNPATGVCACPDTGILTEATGSKISSGSTTILRSQLAE